MNVGDCLPERKLQDYVFRHTFRTKAKQKTSRELLLSKINEHITRLSQNGEKPEVLTLLRKLHDAGLSTKQQLRSAVSVLRYLQNGLENRSIEGLFAQRKALEKLIEDAKNKKDFTKMNDLEEKLFFLNLDLQDILSNAKREKNTIDLDKGQLNFKLSEKSLDENSAYIELKKIFSESDFFVIDELIEETRRYFNYDYPELLLSNVNKPKLVKYVDVTKKLLELTDLEDKIDLLKTNLDYFKDSHFLSRILNKKLFDLQEELKQKILERGKIVYPERLDLKTAVSILNTFKGSVLSGKEIFKYDMSQIKSRLNHDFVINGVLLSFFKPENFPNANSLKSYQLKNMISFLSLFNVFDFPQIVKDRFDNILSSYKKRYRDLESKQTQKIVKKEIFSFLFGELNASRHNSDVYVNRLYSEFKELGLDKDDCVDIMLFLVKGAKLTSSKRALGANYFALTDFISNAVNGLRSYYRSENESSIRSRVNDVLQLLTKYNILRTVPKGTLAINNPREFKSESIKEFVNLVLNLQKE